jgi:endonuclease/exonuclease/phosphatase family metal-dependent hydrolase
MRVVTWNLFHGRSLPPAGEALLAEFAAKLAGWDWDVALLQEVPPWWPIPLARACGAQQRSTSTSRNSLLALRRAVAERRPELIRSNGGGCNAILSRLPIATHTALRMRRWPERRVAQLLRLDDGTCIVNFHASTRPARAEDELARLWQRALAWAGAAPLILGGDLNVREPVAPAGSAAQVAAHEVDHVFARGLTRERAQTLEREIGVGHTIPPARGVERDGGPGRGRLLSDHAPLWVSLRASSTAPGRSTQSLRCSSSASP